MSSIIVFEFSQLALPIFEIGLIPKVFLMQRQAFPCFCLLYSYLVLRKLLLLGLVLAYSTGSNSSAISLSSHALTSSVSSSSVPSLSSSRAFNSHCDVGTFRSSSPREAPETSPLFNFPSVAEPLARMFLS